MNQPVGQLSAQLNVGHLKNVLLLARQGIQAIGAKLPANEGKAAFESLGEVEKFVMEFDAFQQQQAATQQAQGPVAPQVPTAGTSSTDDIVVHTVKID